MSVMASAGAAAAAFFCLLVSLSHTAVIERPSLPAVPDIPKPNVNEPLVSGAASPEQSPVDKLQGIFDGSKSKNIELAFEKFGKSVTALGDQLKLAFDKVAAKNNLTKLKLPEIFKINQTKVKAVVEKIKGEAVKALHIAQDGLKSSDGIVNDIEVESEKALETAKSAEQSIEQTVEQIKNNKNQVNKARRYLQLRSQLFAERRQEEKKPDLVPEHDPIWEDIITKVNAMKDTLDPEKAKAALDKIQEAFKETKERFDKAAEKFRSPESRVRRSTTSDTQKLNDLFDSLKEAFKEEKLQAAFKNVETSLKDLGQTLETNGKSIQEDLKEFENMGQEPKPKRTRRDLHENEHVKEAEGTKELEQSLDALKEAFDPEKIEKKFDGIRESMKQIEQDLNKKLKELKAIFDEKQKEVKNAKRGVVTDEPKADDDEKITEIVNEFKEISKDVKGEEVKDAFIKFAEKIKGVGERFNDKIKNILQDIGFKLKGETEPSKAENKIVAPVRPNLRQIDEVANVKGVKDALGTEHLDDCFQQFEALLKAFKNKIVSNIEAMNEKVETRELAKGDKLSEDWEGFKQEFDRKEVEKAFEDLFNQLKQLKEKLHSRAKHIENDLSSLEGKEPIVKRFLAESKQDDVNIDEGLKKLRDTFDEAHIEEEFQNIDSAIMESNEEFDKGIQQFREWLNSDKLEIRRKALREMAEQEKEKNDDFKKVQDAIKKSVKDLLDLFKDVKPEDFEKPFQEIRANLEKVGSDLKEVMKEIKADMGLKEGPASIDAGQHPPQNTEVSITTPPSRIKRQTQKLNSDDKIIEDISQMFEDISSELPNKDLEKEIHDVQKYLDELCAKFTAFVRDIMGKIGSKNENVPNVQKRAEDLTGLEDLLKQMNQTFDAETIKSEFKNLWKCLEDLVKRMHDGTEMLEAPFKEESEKRPSRELKEVANSTAAVNNKVYQQIKDILVKIKTALDPDNLKKHFEQLKQDIEKVRAEVEQESKAFEQSLDESASPKRQVDKMDHPAVEEPTMPEDTKDNDDKVVVDKAFEQLKGRLAHILQVFQSAVQELRQRLGKEPQMQHNKRSDSPPQKTEEKPKDDGFRGKLEALGDIKSLKLDDLKEYFSKLRDASVGMENKIFDAIKKIEDHLKKIDKDFTNEVALSSAVKRESDDGKDNNKPIDDISVAFSESFDTDAIQAAFTELYDAMSKAEINMEKCFENIQGDLKSLTDTENQMKRSFLPSVQENSKLTISNETIKLLNKMRHGLEKLLKKFNPQDLKDSLNKLHEKMKDAEEQVDKEVEDLVETFTEDDVAVIEGKNPEEPEDKPKPQPPIQNSREEDSREERDVVKPSDLEPTPDLDRMMDALSEEKLTKFNEALKKMLTEGKTLSDALQKFVNKVRLPPLPDLVKLKPLQIR